MEITDIEGRSEQRQTGHHIGSRHLLPVEITDMRAVVSKLKKDVIQEASTHKLWRWQTLRAAVSKLKQDVTQGAGAHKLWR